MTTDRNTVPDAPPGGISCADCEIRSLCLPQGLDARCRAELDLCIRRRRLVKRGEMLYLEGRLAQALYAIRRGSLKAYAVNADGEEFVQAFHLPGEVLGLESLAHDRHDHFAVALEATVYCEIPVAALEELLPRQVPLQRRLLCIVNRRLQQDRRLSLIHNQREARRRLAAFLLEMSRRYGQRKLLSTRFRLSMDRRDIANFLGLSLETVSRSFSRFQRDGLLEAHGKQVELLQPQSLAAACGYGNGDAGRPQPTDGGG